MSKRALIAKLKRIAVQDDQRVIVRQIAALIDELSAAAAGGVPEPEKSLAEILSEATRPITRPITRPVTRPVNEPRPIR